MNRRNRVLFLPGAGGSASFWGRVAGLMPSSWEAILLSWPGLGEEPPDPAIQSIDALVDRVSAHIDRPVDLVAQSIGGIVAVRLALERPELVRRIVLACCSAGLEMSKFGAIDWRPIYLEEYPRAARWITGRAATPEIAFENITAPTLLLWGDSDPISPIAVGRHLAERIRNARLQVIAGAGHDLALTHSRATAEAIRAHLDAVG